MGIKVTPKKLKDKKEKNSNLERIRKELERLGPSPKERQKTRLLHSSKKELEKELKEIKNSPLKRRTNVHRDIDLPNEIKKRELGQEAIGAKGGGMISKQKSTTTRKYKGGFMGKGSGRATRGY